MQIAVAIERINDNGYQAKGFEPFGVVGEGLTCEAALQNFSERIQSRLKAGIQLTLLDIPLEPNPWQKYAGMFKDDPMFAEVVELMAEDRRKADEDPTY